MTPLRLLAIAPVATLLACATTSVRKEEVDDLRKEIRALRESNTRMEQRLSRLEVASEVAQARAKTSASSAPEVPDLVVVKLKPKNEPAPKLPTAVEVQEPPADFVETLITSPPASEALTEDPALLELAFDQAVSNLRTGNVETGVKRLEEFAGRNPRHPRADNALYFAALGRVGLNDVEGAAALLEKLVADYPAGDAVQDGLLKLAECRVRLNQPADAKVLYTRLLTLFPGTAAAAQAEQRLAALSR